MFNGKIQWNILYYISSYALEASYVGPKDSGFLGLLRHKEKICLDFQVVHDPNLIVESA